MDTVSSFEAMFVNKLKYINVSECAFLPNVLHCVTNSICTIKRPEFTFKSEDMGIITDAIYATMCRALHSTL